MTGKPKGGTTGLKPTLQDQINSVGNRVVLAGFLILLVVIGVGFWSFYQLDKSREWISHTYQVQGALSDVLSTLQDAETGQRGFLLTGDENYLEPYNKAVGRLKGTMEKVQHLTLDNPKQKKLLIQAMPLIDFKLKELRETISLMNAQGHEAATSLVRTGAGKNMMDEIRAVIGEMRSEEVSLLTERGQALHKYKAFSLVVGITGFAFLVLMVVFAILKIRALLNLQLEAEKHLEYLASHDPLTGLATRRLALEYTSFALSEASRYKHKVAVLFIDLDDFKPVNDSFGHDVGDSLLRGVAERLVNCVRKADMVARVGGDEFVIVMTKVGSRENVAQIGQKLIDALARPFLIGDDDISISVSVGIALYPDHGQEPETLFKCADKAMYEIKNKGKNDFTFAADRIEGTKGFFPSAI